MKPLRCLNPYSTGRYSMRLYYENLWSILFSLNPYSTGRYSMRELKTTKVLIQMSLNPYSTGRYSMSMTKLTKAQKSAVLILILLEDTLWDC